MRKVVLSVISLLLLFVLYSEAAEDVISLISPKDGAVVSDCPSFKWTGFDTASNYTLTFKRGSNTPFVMTTTKPFLDIVPQDISSLWDIGSYEWSVKSDNGFQSVTQTFSISIHSCLPPVVPNRVNNNFGSENCRQKGYLGSGGDDDNEWMFPEKDKYSANGVNFTVNPLPGGRLLTLKMQETYQGAANEAETSTLTIKLKSGKGDNILAFRALYYSDGCSYVSIELGSWTNQQETPIVLGAIGGKKSDNFKPGWSNWVMPTNNSKSPGLTQGTWSNVPFTFDSEPNKEYGLRFVYHRGQRTADDIVPQGNAANFMLFISAITFGQCSSFTEETYFNDLSVETNGGCFDCPSAGMYLTSDFKTQQCKTCGDITEDPNGCDSISYCSMCYSNNSQCQDSATTNCRAAANCEEKKSSQSCNADSDCTWCPIDNKCVYKDDVDTCTSCNQLPKSNCTLEPDVCHWCPVKMMCEDLSIVCPSCGSLGVKQSCTLSETDSACQWCYTSSKCMSVDEQCTTACNNSDISSCTQVSQDCQWCVSAFECWEQRFSCVLCPSLSESECGNYRGCNYCEFTECQNNDTVCKTCDEMKEDECLKYRKCRYCSSTQKCTAAEVECPECQSLSESDCNDDSVYSGCAYCKSDMECLNKSATCLDCNSINTQTLCLKHRKGCCFSEKEKHCYYIGHEKCKATLGALEISLISVGGAILVAAAILIPVIVCCCMKKKSEEDVEMHQPGTIVVLPEGQPSMVVASESMQSVGLDPMATVSVDATADAGGAPPPAASAQVASNVSMSDMQNILAQQQLLNTMMAQQQMSMMMNPMMVNSMSMMGGMAGMSGMGMGGMPMNNMGMDMNSMAMTGGMNSMNGGDMNSMNMAAMDQTGTNSVNQAQ